MSCGVIVLAAVAAAMDGWVGGGATRNNNKNMNNKNYALIQNQMKSTPTPALSTMLVVCTIKCTVLVCFMNSACMNYNYKQPLAYCCSKIYRQT